MHASNFPLTVTKNQSEFMTKSPKKTLERNLWVWTKQTTQKKICGKSSEKL